MIALIDKSGAFLYDCSGDEFEKRLSKSTKSGRHNTVDYTSVGNARTDRDGMIGWFFPTTKLIEDIELMGCESVFVKFSNADYKRMNKTEFPVLKTAYQTVFNRKSVIDNTSPVLS